MERLRLWLALSCLLAPLTVLSCFKSWEFLTGAPAASATGKWQGRLVCIAALVALKTQHTMLQKLRWELRSRRLGCGPPTVYPHRDPILGLDGFLESVRALREGLLPDLMARRLEAVGRTHYSLALGSWVLATDEPENIKAILATDFDDWSIAGPRLWAVLQQLGPNSVFTSNGAAWRHARASIRPSFVRDQIADLVRFDTHVANLLARLHEACDGGRATIELHDLLARMTMDSSTDFMLGHSTELLLRASPEAARFLEAFDYTSFEGTKRARLGPVTLLLPNRKYDEAIVVIRSYVRSYVAGAVAVREKKAAAAGGENKGGQESHVFLHQILDAGADEEYVLDQVLSIILAGRDTTASALSAVFYFLARSPEAWRKLKQEVREMEAKNPTWEQLRGMKYMQNVIREALRLFPPVGSNSRAANKDVILPRGGGPDGKLPLLVPKGTFCRWWSTSMHRRKDIYGPDADEFRPERWEELRVGWEYIPFSGGPRICIGQQFALTQMSYVIFRILQNFDAIEPRDPGPMRVRVSVISTLEKGCLVSLTPTSDAK